MWYPICCEKLWRQGFRSPDCKCVENTFSRSIEFLFTTISKEGLSTEFKRLIMSNSLANKHEVGDILDARDLYVITYIDSRNFDSTILRVTDIPIKTHTVECIKRYVEIKKAIRKIKDSNNLFDNVMPY